METSIKFENINKFSNDLNECIECGNCTLWCPIYQEKQVDEYVARGKNKLVKKILCGKEDYNKKNIDILGMCTLCGTCAEHCPVKCQMQSVTIAARADKVNAKGVGFLPKIIYQKIIPKRYLFGQLVRFASYIQRVFFKKAEGRMRHLPLFLSAIGKGRQIPAIAPKFLRQIIPAYNKPPQGVETKMRVGYFMGCSTDFIFPDIGEKVIGFLNKNGIEVIVPKEQGCCGAPIWLGAGDFETGRGIAHKNCELFDGVDYVISNCATCTSAVKDYPKYLADTNEALDKFTKFAHKIIDVNEFITDVLKLNATSRKASPEVTGKIVTWHDPCHLNRYLKVKNQPREILKSIQGIKYVEMREADRCCGMAGAFSVYHYDVSKNIADRKAQCINETGADIVATGCPGCMIQLMDCIERNKLPQKVMHIMELIG
jgi:glycolate oxidase iron-sulfur subunit